MLSVIIIFALYILFIGDSVNSGLKFLPHPNRLMRAWMLAGMLASASITTSLGAYGVMISDRENKAIKDFYSSPVSRRQVAGGYIVTGFIIKHHHVHFYLNFWGNLPGSGRRGSTGYRDFTKVICCNCLISLCIIGDCFLYDFFLEDQQLLLSRKHDSWDLDRLFGWGIHSNRQLARQRSVAGKVLPMCSFSGTLPAAFDEACNKGKFCQSAGKCTKRDQGNVWDCLRL